MDFGAEQHGCEHYRRGCRVVAPCCGEVFGCRHCHNDAKNSLEVDPRHRHEIPRCCYSNVLKDSHRCVERAMHHNCPVCFEYLFDSTKDISVLQCGHTIHLECMNEMRAHHHFSCPVCSRSACDMTDTWRKLDEEVAATPMPEIYQKKMVWILCNDCSATSSVQFHVLGQKCPGCNSYNTRETRGGPVPAARSRV
nr:unnamed protein product [Digitaria exilis]